MKFKKCLRYFAKNYILSLLHPNDHQMELNGKEGFIQDYHNRGERWNSTPLKQKAEEFLSIRVSGKVLEEISGKTWSIRLEHLRLLIGTSVFANACQS